MTVWSRLMLLRMWSVVTAYHGFVAGVPIYTRGGYVRRPLSELFEPSTSLPMSRLARDPWWWDYPSLRPYTLPYGWNKSPFYLRDSYLSPVKRTYLWGQHPIRPFGR